MPSNAERARTRTEQPISVLGVVTSNGGCNRSTASFMQTAALVAIPFARNVGAFAYFALRRFSFHPIERVMGQQHRVRVKRRRRSAYLDRKKVAAKAAPVRKEPPKTKAKQPKKQATPAPET